MAKIRKEQDKTFISFSNEEASQLNIGQSKEYEFSPAKEGILVLTETGTNANAPEAKKETPLKKIDEIEQRITGYIKKFSLSERVEGNFEKKLSKEEQQKFLEMLESKKVEKFKLNPTYKKAVYQLTEPNPAKDFDNKEKPIADFSLESDGFLVVRNENRAKELSNQLAEQIRDGTIKGTRSFSGDFYIIKNDLLNSVQEKVLNNLKQSKKTVLEEMSKKMGLTKTLIKIAIEFLKEEGQVIEKHRDSYEYIE